MAFNQAFVRITINGTVTERIGTLEEIVRWIENDEENIYNIRFCYWDKGYTWFTDYAPCEPQDVTEEQRATYGVSREVPGGGWELNKTEVHDQPLPVTAANVENFVQYVVAKSNPGKESKVEIIVSTVKEASDRVYAVILSKNGQDGVEAMRGTLEEIVRQMEKNNTVKFSSLVRGFDFETGDRVIGHRWFTDWVRENHQWLRSVGVQSETAPMVYTSANHTVPTVEVYDDDFHQGWFRVIPMPHTVENVAQYVHFTTARLNDSAQWSVELKEI